MAGGLLWAAIVLGLLTWWIAAKFWDSTSLAVVLAGCLAVLALALSVWQFRTPASQEAALKQRRALGLMLIVSGILLFVLAVWLIAQEGQPAFAEFSGAILMALIALGAGVTQRATPGEQSFQDRFLNRLLGAQQLAKTGFFVIAAVLAGGGIWFVMDKGWLIVYPEAIGVFVVAMVFAGAGFWLAIAKPEEVTAHSLRVLVLIVGGLTGLALTLATLLRIFAWWRTVFGAGVKTWQGPEAWRFWVCIYGVLAGLAIMFGSLLLARADVRTNAVMRRLLYGYNTLLTGLLMLAILVVLNVMVYVTYPYTFDWTQTRGIHTLSPSTKNLLEGLKEPAKVYVIMSPNSPLYAEMRQLLDNARAYSDLLQVQYVSPDQDRTTYKDLEKRFPDMVREAKIERGMESDEGGRGVLVVYGPESAAKAPHAFIPARDLTEFNRGGPQGRKATLAFKGEDVVMTQIRFLADRQSKPRIYFTQGSGELDITDAAPMIGPDGRIVLNPGGAAKLLDRLKQDNYDVRGLAWGAPPKKAPAGDLIVFAKKEIKDNDEVPTDAKVVVIAGTRVPWPKGPLEALDRYLQKNGKLILLANILVARNAAGNGLVYQPTGLEELLKKYNVDLAANFVLRMPGSREDDPTTVLATIPPRAKNKIAVNFRSQGFLLDLARTVKPASGPAPFEAEAILEVARRPNQEVFWAETDPNGLINPFQFVLLLRQRGLIQDRMSAESLPVAVAVSDREQKPRMVVIGDASFASNTVSRSAVPYYDFLTSSMEWLAERPTNIGIKPKESSSFALGPTVHYDRMIWLPLGLMVLTIVGAGTGIWVVRRR